MRLLVTGSEGYLGQRVLAALVGLPEVQCWGIDILPQPRRAGYHYQCLDIRSPAVADLIAREGIDQVLHLASILQPSADRQRDYEIEVVATEQLLRACVAHQVQHITITSSGAAYGYHADQPEWLVESDPLRGHPAFSYSEHKRLIEQLCAEYRQHSPQLQQLILRPGTVLGATTDNPITKLFRGRRLLGVQGSPSPFVFIWDEDLVQIVLIGLREQRTGIYNVAGDGALTLEQLAQRLGKPTLRIPAWLLRAGLWLGQRLRLTAYGPEQVDFLRYRPVLSNRALREQFGYQPAKTSAEVFEYFLQHNTTLRAAEQPRRPT